MRKLILITLSAALIAPSLASATTLYFIDGKQVTKGEALITGLQNPGTKILKVQVNWVRANEQKATLRKLADASLNDIPKK